MHGENVFFFRCRKQYTKHEEACFIGISKQREVGWKKSRFFFNQLLGVWKPDETLFRVFKQLLKLIIKYRENEGGNYQNRCLFPSNDGFPNHLYAYDFSVQNWCEKTELELQEKSGHKWHLGYLRSHIFPVKPGKHWQTTFTTYGEMTSESAAVSCVVWPSMQVPPFKHTKSIHGCGTAKRQKEKYR